MRALIYPLVVAAAALSGCAATPVQDTPSRAAPVESALPPMKTFAGAPAPTPTVSNANIVADFQNLHFMLESGRALPVFTRFEGPITVKVTGAPPASLGPDLRRLIDRIRKEADIDIRQVASGDASIVIEAVSRDDIRRALPQAACFVVPNVTSLEEFRRDRRKAKTNWALLTERTRLAVFLPNDTSPQEVRDCLHEEIAQAIGPLNDLYHLPNSVFNDDNVHTVLTGFDMLILKAGYAPELKSGMTQEQVAAVLPGVVARLNPAGNQVRSVRIDPTPRSWIGNVQTALGPGSGPSQRTNAANAALSTASRRGWRDHRRAFSHYMVGRMAQISNPTLAQQHYASAQYYLANTPGTDLHAAYITTQTAAYDVSRGDGMAALLQLDPAIDIAKRSENAALLSTLMLLKAEALDLTGRPDAARSVRLDSLGWARYGFGADWAVRAKLREVSALNPAKAGERRL